MSNPIVDPLVENPDVSPTTQLVDIEATPEGAVTVVLNRPARRNALDADMISALEEAFRTLQGAEGVRVVFLRAAGSAFSAGADLDWMRAAADRSESDNRTDAMEMAKMFKQLWDIPVLTVALVDGPARGGGAGLVAACDMAVATAGASFGFPEVKVGLIAATISPYVVQAVGPRAARGLFALGRTVDAARAQQIGLIDEVVADAATLDAVQARIATEVMATAPGAVAASKDLVSDVAGRPIDHGLMEETARRIAAARVSEEGQEGVKAFLARHKPSWTRMD